MSFRVDTSVYDSSGIDTTLDPVSDQGNTSIYTAYDQPNGDPSWTISLDAVAYYESANTEVRLKIADTEVVVENDNDCITVSTDYYVAFDLAQVIFSQDTTKSVLNETFTVLAENMSPQQYANKIEEDVAGIQIDTSEEGQSSLDISIFNYAPSEEDTYKVIQKVLTYGEAIDPESNFLSLSKVNELTSESVEILYTLKFTINQEDNPDVPLPEDPYVIEKQLTQTIIYDLDGARERTAILLDKGAS
jgi:hypothetical protein